MNLLDVKHLSVRYGALTIVNDVNFSLSEGEWLMIVGPNGAGKSTILNAISQGTPYTGEVLVQERDIKRLRAREIARSLGVLSQSHAMGYGFTVGAVVRLGRYAYSPGLFSGSGEEDEPMVARALELTGLTRFADQNVLTLSGGELQRTFLAQLFAQNPSVLLLDEPTNHLDLVYQKQVFELMPSGSKPRSRGGLRGARSQSRAGIWHARVLLDGGQTAAIGEIGAVFAPEYINKPTRWMCRLDAAHARTVAGRRTYMNLDQLRQTIPAFDEGAAARAEARWNNIASPLAALVCSNARWLRSRARRAPSSRTSTSARCSCSARTMGSPRRASPPRRRKLRR